MKRTKTTETYILPEQFEHYNKLGFVIFMAKPTKFNTYKAVKIELVYEIPEQPVQHFTVLEKGVVKRSKNFFGGLNLGFLLQ